MKKSNAERFGEFVGLSVFAIALLTLLALSVSITYFVVTWAFGMR